MPDPQDLDARFRAYAEEHVRATRRVSGVDLDRSPESLGVLDRLITEWRQGRVPDRLDAVVTPFAAYLGEVLIRNLGGRWAVDEKFGVVVAAIGGRDEARAMPVSQAGRRFVQGEAQSLVARCRDLARVVEHLAP